VQSQTPPAHPKVLVVGIDEDALARFGRWPWPRSVHSGLVALLLNRPPATVAFDLLFTEPSEDPAIDQQFADALVLLPSAITAAFAETLDHVPRHTSEFAANTKAIARIKGDPAKLIGNDTGLLPVQIIAESSHAGFVNSPPESDGVRRRLPLIVRCGRGVFPSLALQALLLSEKLDTDAVEVFLGSHVRVTGKKQTWDRRAFPSSPMPDWRPNYRCIRAGNGPRLSRQCKVRSFSSVSPPLASQISAPRLMVRRHRWS
jgi:adenylate cyclase